MRIRNGYALPAGLLLLLSFGGGPVSAQFFSREAESPVYKQPAENLLLIVADVQRHLRDDVYQFPYPVDVNGQNTFRACLVRLANYEKMYPGRMPDVVALTKGQCFEKLCAFKEAALNFEAAQKSGDAAIKKLATEGFDRAKKFSERVDQPVDQSSLRSYEEDMKKKIASLDRLVSELKGSANQSLALVERERAQMQLAQFYICFRFMKPYSTDDALKQLKQNIDRNPNSKNRHAHRMMLADLYYSLSREYTILHDPEGPDFRLGAFNGFANRARAEYSIVEKADGFPEKAEARSKLAALEAYVQQVTDRGR